MQLKVGAHHLIYSKHETLDARQTKPRLLHRDFVTSRRQVGQVIATGWATLYCELQAGFDIAYRHIGTRHSSPALVNDGSLNRAGLGGAGYGEYERQHYKAEHCAKFTHACLPWAGLTSYATE